MFLLLFYILFSSLVFFAHSISSSIVIWIETISNQNDQL